MKFYLIISGRFGPIEPIGDDAILSNDVVGAEASRLDDGNRPSHAVLSNCFAPYFCYCNFYWAGLAFARGCTNGNEIRAVGKNGGEI